MATATLSSGSASAWSGKSILDATALVKPGQVVLNNNLAATHTVAGIDMNQSSGETYDILNRGTSDIIIAANDTAADAKNRFATAIYLPAGGKVRAFYNGTQWEPFQDVGAPTTTKLVTFTENATNTLHTGTVTLPPGSWLVNIEIINEVLWGAASASLKVGDTADDDGWFVGVDCKATDLLVGEVLDIHSSTLWGGKEGAYLVAATGRRGPTSSNFAKYYKAGSNITGIMTVGTPAATTGRTHMVVRYAIPNATAAVATGP